MNLFSLVIASLLGLLTLAFGVLLFTAILFNLNAGRKYRHGLARELDRLRLGRMLTALGIDIDTYLHRERVVDIQAQMNRCSGCGNTEQCDENLARGEIGSEDIGFCNNEADLKVLAEQQARRPSRDSA